MSLRYLVTFGVVLAGAAVAPGLAIGGEEETAGRVNADVVRLRAGPGTRYTIVGKVRLGARIAVLGEKEGWYMTPFPAGRWCWIAKRYIRVTGKAMAGGKPGMVTANNVRIRAAGDLRSVIVAVRNAGDKVNIVGEAGDWYKVSPPEEARAWIYREYVDLLEEDRTPKIEVLKSGDDSGGDEILEAAGATDDVDDTPLGETGGVQGVGKPGEQGLRTTKPPVRAGDAPPIGGGTVKPEEVPAAQKPAEGGDIPGVNLAGMSTREKLATAEGIYRGALEKNDSAGLVTAGMIFARLANDYFADNDTRTVARVRLRAVVVKLPPSDQRKLIAFERQALRDELAAIRKHYEKELDELTIPPRRRRYTAIGVIEEVPKVRGRPGDYRLIVGKLPYHYLRSRRVDLGSYAGKKVGILGNFDPAPTGASYRVLDVVVVEPLPELEE